MAASREEKNILRELAKRYAEVASLDKQEQTKRRMIANNGLKPGRPLVYMDEIPWHEMDIDGKLKLHCEDKFFQRMESFFRRTLFQWEYFPADMYVENAYVLHKTVYSTGNGFTVKEDTIAIDQSNHIISHGFHDQLENEKDAENFKIPVISVNEAEDQRNQDMAEDILGGILPVKLRGVGVSFEPWDTISRYRGVTPILFDLADRPEHLHNIIKRFTQGSIAVIEQYEKLGLLANEFPYLHCTPAFTDDLPAKDYEGGPVRLKDVWFRAMAQMFSDVSPEMHEEFDIQYAKPIADRCGLVYYGCCEALDKKIEMLRRNFPNLRKIGVSPWANEEACAEQIGKDFVYACKPNPAKVAIATDPDEIRKDTKKTVELCIKHGCSFELVLKDISTVSYRPQNLIIWEKTVMETLDSYYS